MVAPRIPLPVDSISISGVVATISHDHAAQRAALLNRWRASLARSVICCFSSVAEE